MHLRHIYYKIKHWIHGDDMSYKLINIVHMCGRWMMKIQYSFYEFMSLFERHEDMRFIYSWTFICRFFHAWTIMGPPSLSPSLSSFFEYPMSLSRNTRERSSNMKFYFVAGWNGIANVECRKLACGVYLILIRQT